MNKLRNLMLAAEWELLKHSKLEPEYELGDSWYYATVKGQGKGLRTGKHKDTGLFNND